MHHKEGPPLYSIALGVSVLARAKLYIHTRTSPQSPS